jgi:hypothetical protein
LPTEDFGKVNRIASAQIKKFVKIVADDLVIVRGLA